MSAETIRGAVLAGPGTYHPGSDDVSASAVVAIVVVLVLAFWAGLYLIYRSRRR